MLLNAFIKSQKYTVMRTLEKKFSRYLRHSDDQDEELLAFTLNRLFTKELHFFSAQHGAPQEDFELSVECDEFEQHARDLQIFDVNPFYASATFQRLGYTHDAPAKRISKAF